MHLGGLGRDYYIDQLRGGLVIQLQPAIIVQKVSIWTPRFVQSHMLIWMQALGFIGKFQTTC